VEPCDDNVAVHPDAVRPAVDGFVVTAFRWGLLVWGAWIVEFLALELPAHFGWVPWPTLSSTSWDAESAWHTARLLFLVFLLVLAGHIVFKLSAAALIVVVAVAAVALVEHFIAGAL
jgi:hypothetical protein